MPRSSPPLGRATLSPDFVRTTLANFCFFLSFASFFLLPLHVRELGGSDQTVGFVMGATGFTGLLAVFAVAPLLDRYGRIAFLRGGLATMMLASLAFLHVETIGPEMFALRAIQGLAFAATFNAASTLAAEFSPPGERARTLGLFGVSTLTTHAIAPMLGEQVIARSGFAGLFLMAAGFAGLGLTISFSVSAPPRSSAPRRADDGTAASSALLACYATAALCGLAFGTVITFTPTFVTDEQLGAVSLFFASYTVTALATRLFGSGLPDRLGHRVVLGPTIAALAGIIAGLAFVHTTTALVIDGLLFGLAQGLAYPTLNAYTLARTPERLLGRVQSLFNGAFNVGVTTGSFVLGGVVRDYGHRTAFLIAAAAALGGLVVLVVSDRGIPLVPSGPAAES